MREILFRARRANKANNGEWEYMHFIRGFDSKNEKYLYNVDTVCEFTGLHDKNGVKIFEKDIVKFEYKPNKINKIMELYMVNGIFSYTGVVVFEDCQFVVQRCNEHRLLDDVRLSDMCEKVNYDNATIEIIGNIYDNPELVKTGCDSN